MQFFRTKLFWKIAIVALLIIVVFFAVKFLGGSEDVWLCEDSGWVKHGNPNAAIPITPCGSQKQPDEVLLTMPKLNQVVISPLIVEGQAGGNWFFEASFPIELIDDQGKVLGQGHVQALSDWMTSDFVPFKGEINYQVAATTTGKLVLKRDNPSGLPQNDKKIEMPVLISPSQTITVKAFFGKYGLDSSMLACEKVYPVERIVAKTDAIGRAALEQLLAGLKPGEEKEYFNSINPGVKIQKLTITDGIAKVDFDETMEKDMGGSCRVIAIRAQITETLKQFSTVKDVIISINGRTEDILQP